MLLTTYVVVRKLINRINYTNLLRFIPKGVEEKSREISVVPPRSPKQLEYVTGSPLTIEIPQYQQNYP
jgi:hypothetical protein